MTKLTFMKPLHFILFFCVSLTTFSQEKPDKNNGLFYKISLAPTLTSNEEFDLSDEENKNLFKFGALFLNNTLGYQFDQRTSIGLNFEYAGHLKQDLHFFPAYLSFRYNVFVDDDNLFIRTGYGKLLNMGRRFETGNMYKIGIGLQTFDDDYRNSFLLGLDFTRKRFGYKTLEGLSSVSFFIEFQVF